MQLRSPLTLNIPLGLLLWLNQFSLFADPTHFEGSMAKVVILSYDLIDREAEHYADIHKLIQKYGGVKLLFSTYAFNSKLIDVEPLYNKIRQLFQAWDKANSRRSADEDMVLVDYLTNSNMGWLPKSAWSKINEWLAA